MRLSRTSCRAWIIALAACAPLVFGCARWRWPRIDPSGRQFFIYDSDSPQPYGGPQYGQPQYDQPASPESQPQYSPAAPGPATVPSGSGSTGSQVSITPRRKAAPIGSEVILVATACERGQSVAKQRLEWTLVEGSVGQFVAVGRNTLMDKLAGDFNNPRKVNNAFAIGSTSRTDFTLDRDTPSPADDVVIRRGQGWISLTSPVEGTSRVTVYAPEMPAWDARTAEAEIHWIDATWHFPAPAINPAGTSHQLTTTVTRSSDGTPSQGWIVRYTIEDGPEAVFLPDRSKSMEVSTDASGQAVAEIAQLQAQRGTNRVAIEILRPDGLDASEAERQVVERSTVLLTWTAAELSVEKKAPAQAGISEPFLSRIEVTSPGDVALEDVTVTDVLPEGLVYVDSNPPAQVTGNTLSWSLGQVPPAAGRTIELRCRSDQLGEVVNQVNVSAAGGMQASDSSTTEVVAPKIEIRMSQPGPVTVGGVAKFLMQFTNRGQVPAARLRIKDTLGPGLEHPAADEEGIKRDIEGSLQPGETQEVDVNFTTTRAGRLCHTVEVFGPEGLRARAEGCVTVVEPSTAPPQQEPAEQPKPEPSLPPLDVPSTDPEPQAPGEQQPEPSPPLEPLPTKPSEPTPRPTEPGPADQPPAEVSVRVTGPQEVAEGELAKFYIDVTNSGKRPLTNVEVVNRFDTELKAENASDGYRYAGSTLSWTIDRLPVGQTAPLQLHFTARQAAEAACNEVSVTSAEGVTGQGRACVRIRPARSELSIAVADLRDPVAVKKGLTYEIRVTNRASTAARGVTLTAIVPAGMIPDPIGTSGPPEVEYFINEQRVEFKPIAEIPAGKTVTYRVRVRTVVAGKQTFRVELTGPGQAQPVREEEVTEVFE